MAKQTGKALVIVESPAKAKTINKYLGSDYIVKASMGHVRDLPKKGMCVDLETFEPKYEVIAERGKEKLVKELRALAKNASEVYLATDLDREGEAIAWHLKEALGIPDDQAQRVIFNAITKTEIQKAFKNPHKIDIDRVNAQQARRILDRIVGYEVSPLLWRKVAKGLSAGRVQSVAVRLIVDRDRDIDAFIPTEHWKINALFCAGEAALAAGLSKKWTDFLINTGNGERTKAEKDKWMSEHGVFNAELVEFAGKKFEPSDKETARTVAEAIGFVVKNVNTVEDPEGKGPAKHLTTITGALGQLPPFTVKGIEKKRTTSRPPAPFITSTLQQSASSRLGFSADRTMRTAQKLYESGHITYMRTDSTNLSSDALSMARGYIKSEFGERYLPEKAISYASSNKSAQEAHEAIRPTDVNMTAKDAHAKLSGDEYKLYSLIWTRFVACQMPPAEFDQTAVTISTSTKSGEALFRATGRKLVFDGFMKVAGVSSEDQLLPDLAKGSRVNPIEIAPSQHFTQPPPRFTEASLVKELERLGIGRPSTYASIIKTIQDREYVTQLDRRFFSTQLGQVVTDKLVEGFKEMMDVSFTADMELKLDKIEEQHIDWKKFLRDWYGPFHELVGGALGKLGHAGGSESPYTCPKCKKPMLYRISKNGFFLACSDRECGTTQPVDEHGKPKLVEKSEITCPKCGREMVKRKGRFGEFLGCTGYGVKDENGKPSCDCIINLDKDGRPQPPKTKIQTNVPCEKCGSPMILRDSKRGPFLGCSSFPKCRATKQVAKLEGKVKEYVETLVPALKEGGAKAAELAAKISSQFGDMPTPVRTGPISTDIDCDDCGKPMVIRSGKRGPFLGCSGYPKCKNTGEVPAKLMEEMGLNGEKKEEKELVPLAEDHE